MFTIYKIAKKIIIFIVLVIFVFFLLSRGHIYDERELRYGLTFSPKKAIELGYDWREMYLDILDDLKIKRIRLSAYWDWVEKEQGEYFWHDIDWQINEAASRDVEIILAVGGRLPRWPECHFPEWTKGVGEVERQKRTMDYIEATVNRYKDNEAIKYWQVENEPFLSKYFGECPEVDPAFLDREIALVKSLDDRDIIVTDSGELSLWVRAADRADIFGTTMYRDTYSKHLEKYIHYPIGPGFFRFKKNMTRFFAQPEEWIVIEMQAEPWGPKPFHELSNAERAKTMDLQKFEEMLEFGHKAGFKTFYLWGVEYWYWEKERGDHAYWNRAKELLHY